MSAIKPQATMTLPTDRTAPLAPGDRAPDFLLPDQNRSVDPFYNLVQGGPIVLHFFPNSRKTAFRAEFDGLRAQSGAFADRAGATCQGISSDERRPRPGRDYACADSEPGSARFCDLRRDRVQRRSWAAASRSIFRTS